MGHSFEGPAKEDPTIRFLVSKLATKVPKLAKKISEGQEYVSISPGGKATGYLKAGEFVTRSCTLDDGSLIQHTPDAEKSIQRMLKRQNIDEGSIFESLQRLQCAPENIRVTLAGGLEVVKWGIEQIEPALDGRLLSPMVPFKSAYEFLALHLNSAIYEEVPALVAAREALSGGALDPTQFLVERLHAPTARPFHGIVFEGNLPYAKVQVRLFGQLAFRVHFKTLSVGGPQFVYTHDLETNTEHVAHLSADEDGW